MKPNDEVLHPQWGRGTILFDKPHCIGIRFLEWGQVNFSQEEWALQKSSAERFRGSISDLEYMLDSAVEEGSLSETQACELLNRKAHALEVRRLRGLPIDEAYERFSSNQLSEEEFYTILKRFISSWVARQAMDSYTFQNTEEAISESLLEVWQRLKEFDKSRTGFKTFVSIIVRSNVQDQLRRHKSLQGPFRYVELDEDTVGASKELSQEKRLLFEEWLKGLDPTDRNVVQMMRDGLTQEQIALALDVAQGTVAKRLARIRREEKPPF